MRAKYYLTLVFLLLLGQPSWLIARADGSKPDPAVEAFKAIEQNTRINYRWDFLEPFYHVVTWDGSRFKVENRPTQPPTQYTRKDRDGSTVIVHFPPKAPVPAEVLQGARAALLAMLDGLKKSDTNESYKAFPKDLTGLARWPGDVMFGIVRLPELKSGQTRTGYEVIQAQVAAENTMFGIYGRKPSSLRSAAYLELALVDKALDIPNGYQRDLDAAIATLNLVHGDFSADAEGRKNIRDYYSFGRPETCILFLKAEDLRTTGQTVDAQRLYTGVIDTDPSSPYAWEALAKLSAMNVPDHKVDGKLLDKMLESFPAIWGVVQPATEDAGGPRPVEYAPFTPDDIRKSIVDILEQSQRQTAAETEPAPK